MVKYACLGLVLMSCLVAEAQEEPYFKLYKNAEYPNMDGGNFHILQDSIGYMWVANKSCLKRFDGKRFKHFLYESQGVAEKGQVVGFKDYKNRLWFVGIGGRITKYENGQLEPYAFNDSVSSWLTMSNCISLYVDSNEVIYFGLQNRGSFHVSPNGEMTWDAKQSENPSGIYFKLIGGRLFAYGVLNNEQFDKRVPVYEVTEGGAMSLRATIYENSSEEGAGQFGALRYMQRADGSLLFALNNRLLSVKGERYERVSTSVPMTGLFEDSRGGMWLSSIYKSGVHYSAMGNLNEEEMQRFVEDDVIHSITEDHQGGIWLSGSSNGLYYHGFPYYSRYPPMIFDTISTIADLQFDLSKGMIFGSNKQGFINSYNGIYTTQSRIFWSMSETRVLDANSSKNSLYLSSGRRLWSLSSGNVAEIQLNGKEFNGTIRSFCYNADSSAYWISTGCSVCKIVDDEVVECSETQPYEIIETMFFNGFVYIGTRNGLWRLEGTKWVDLTSIDERFKGLVGHMVVYDEALWVFNYEKGAAIMHEGHIQHYNLKGSNLPNVVHSVVHGDSLLAIATLGRLYVVKASESIRTYKNELIPGPFFFARCASEYFKVNDGSIDFGATDGAYYRLDFNDVKRVPKPEVHILGLSVNKKKRRLKKHFVLPYDSNNLIVTFTGFSYHSDGTSHFRYRMTGVDEWTNTSEFGKRFTTLPPGDYSFDISAFNVIGQESSPKSITFTILPPFYETWWFRLLYISGIAMAVWLLFRLRINQLKRKARLLSDLHSSQHQALSARMSPHFIFNALNSIQQFTLRNDKESTAAYMRDYAQLMRLVMDNSKDNLVDLSSEMKAMDLYLKLERLRTQNQISYTISEEDGLDLDRLYLPALFLQPYLENAIWHGLMSKKEPGGHVHVKLGLYKKQLKIVIEDNGVGREKAKKLGTSNHPGFESQGMSITERRIDLINRLYKVNISISIENRSAEEGKDVGTKVTLIIPQV